MKTIRFLLLITLLMPVLTLAESDGQSQEQGIQVIVNRQAELTELTQQQVVGLFLGRARNFPNGKAAKPFDNEVGSDIRARFFERLTGKSISDIDAYWARLRYSGRASPPAELDDTGSILEEVKQNIEAIAYIPWQDPEELAKQDIVVVYTVKN